MKTRKLRKLLGALRLDGAACLVVRDDPEGRLAMALVHAGPRLATRTPGAAGLPIVVIPVGARLEAMDVEAMRRAGWVRA